MSLRIRSGSYLSSSREISLESFRTYRKDTSKKKSNLNMRLPNSNQNHPEILYWIELSSKMLPRLNPSNLKVNKVLRRTKRKTRLKSGAKSIPCVKTKNVPMLILLKYVNISPTVCMETNVLISIQL